MEQALRLTAGLLLGAALGLLYELLRPLRRRAGRAAALFDVLFALLGGLASFLFACTAPDARLGTWELAAMLAGFLFEQGAAARLRRILLGGKSSDSTKKDGLPTKKR